MLLMMSLQVIVFYTASMVFLGCCDLCDMHSCTCLCLSLTNIRLRLGCVDPGEGRMYRETPADLVPKAKATKARGVRAPPPQPGVWELLGSSVEELTELGQKLQRSKKKPDRLLASKVVKWSFLQLCCFFGSKGNAVGSGCPISYASVSQRTGGMDADSG